MTHRHDLNYLFLHAIVPRKRWNNIRATELIFLFWYSNVLLIKLSAWIRTEDFQNKMSKVLGHFRFTSTMQVQGHQRSTSEQQSNSKVILYYATHWTLKHKEMNTGLEFSLDWNFEKKKYSSWMGAMKWKTVISKSEYSANKTGDMFRLLFFNWGAIRPSCIDQVLTKQWLLEDVQWKGQCKWADYAC